MSFGDQLKKRREELGLSRSELADRLGVSRSAVGNYETGVSAPKEEVLLRLFDALHVEPNYLYRDAYRGEGEGVSDEETAHTLSKRQVVEYLQPTAKGCGAAFTFERAVECRAYSPEGEFLALCRGEDGKLITVKSFFSPESH